MGQEMNFKAWMQTSLLDYPEHTIPLVKDGGGGITMWGCFCFPAAGKLDRLNRMVDGGKYR